MGSQLSLGASEQPGEVSQRGLGVGGDYVWRLVMVVVFMGLGGVKWVVEGFKVMIWEATTSEEPIFKAGVDPSRHHVECTKVSGLPHNIFYCLKAYDTH